ncbi:MAG: hypothetical protein HY815_30470, partial [Candidatus Riflebacteria bacterium]|nr:hypothetical protein [Candidatus Riflebacteria bacterium]
SLEDVVDRSGVPGPILQRLAASGACASFGLDRREAVWRLQAILRRGVSPLLDRSPVPPEPAPLPPMELRECLVRDYAAVGLSYEVHPIELVRPDLGRHGVVEATRLSVMGREQQGQGRGSPRVRAAGLVISRQQPPTAKGFMFLTLEDETGFVNVVVKPPVVDRFQKTVALEPMLVVEGVLETEAGVVNLVAERFAPISISGVGVRFRSRDFR